MYEFLVPLADDRGCLVATHFHTLWPGDQSRVVGNVIQGLAHSSPMRAALLAAILLSASEAETLEYVDFKSSLSVLCLSGTVRSP